MRYSDRWRILMKHQYEAVFKNFNLLRYILVFSLLNAIFSKLYLPERTIYFVTSEILNTI